jgi:PKD repeat protein
VVGSSVAFNATTSSDADGHITTYAWNYGDGSAAGGGATSSHTYTHAGTYTATLTIADSDGQSASASHTVTVAPGSTPPPSYSPPTAAFSAPSGNEGVPMTLSGAGSTDPNPGGSLSYAWSFGDGSPAGTGRTITHAFQAGTWTVTLTVTDSASGLKGSASHLVAVADEAPRAAFTDPTGRAGQVIAFSGSGTDTDGSIAAYKWNFGDGATAAGSHATHVYAAAGSYMATLTVVDSSGHTASVSHAVYIAARPNVCVVPRLKGMTRAQARRALAGAHCALGKTKTPKAPKKKAGKGKHWELIVAKQTPAPGTTEPSGSRVALKLAYKTVRN